MTLHSQPTIRAIGFAVLIWALPLSTVEAGHRSDACKDDIEAEAVVHGTGHHAMHHAHQSAIKAWKHKVAAKYGWGYARWHSAQDINLDCDSHRGKTTCEVEADPCH